jgi:hypothetical protein
VPREGHALANTLNGRSCADGRSCVLSILEA